MDRILIAGVAGFLGSNLALKLLENEDNYVVGIDNFSSSTMSNLYPLLKNPRFEFIDKDVQEDININCDYVFNLSGTGDLKRYYDDKYSFIIEKINITKNLIEYCKQNGSKLITTTFYPDYQETKKELFELFNAQKLIDDLLNYEIINNRLNAKIARIDEIYGKNMLNIDKRFIPNAIVSAFKNQNIILNNNESAYFTYYKDFIKSFIHLAFNEHENYIADIISKDLFLKSDVAKLIINYTKSNSEIVISNIEQITPSYKPKNDNIYYEPQTPILEGICETIDHFKLLYFS